MSEQYGLCGCKYGPLNPVLWLPERYAKKGMAFYLDDFKIASLGWPVIRNQMTKTPTNFEVEDVYHFTSAGALEKENRQFVLEADITPMNVVSPSPRSE